MPKTVEQFIADRKNTGNVVYEKSVQMICVIDRRQSSSFEIETPVKATCSIEVLFSSSNTSMATLSLKNVPDSKTISSNYQFEFVVKGFEKPSDCYALASRIVELDIEKHYSTGNINVTFRFQIKYVGNPRLRNKLYDDSIGCSATQFFKNMLENSVLADFKFIVGGKEFNVHKSVMASASPMLFKMFTIDMTENKEGESRIDHIRPEAFEAMLKFVYGGEISKDVDRRELYAAAHYYEIEPLKALCEQEVHTSLIVDNALDIFTWAYPYEELEELKYDAWDVIKLKVVDNLGNDKFETMDFKVIKEILEKVTSLKQTVDAFSKVSVDSNQEQE